MSVLPPLNTHGRTSAAIFIQAAAGRTRVMASTGPAVRNVRPREEMREPARGKEPVASPGGSILLQPFVMEFAAALLPARDLARVCATSSQHRGHAAALANATLDAEHGVTLRKNATFADMHSLNGVPDTFSIDLREHGRGANGQSAQHDLCRVVQGQGHARPVAAGDTWSVDLALRFGVY